MPQIPLYKQNVAPTSQGTGAQLSVEAAVAPWREATKLGLTIAGEIKDYQASRKRQQEINERLEVEKLKAEDTLLKLDIKNRIGIARNVYESGLQTRTDYRNFGTDGDKELGKYNKTVNDLISDPRLKDHPQLAQELKIHAYGEYANAQIDANTIGAKELHNQTRAVEETTLDGLSDRGMPEDLKAGEKIINESTTLTDAEKNERIIKFNYRAQEVNIQKNIEFNPKVTLDAIKEQQKGVATRWPDMSPEDLTKWENAARISYNRQSSENATSMWDRFNKVRDGKTDKDNFDLIEKHLNNLNMTGKISPSDYNSIKKAIDNPYGEVKTPMDAETLNGLWNQIGEYDPETDSQFTKASELWATINAVPNEQDRTLLKGLMKDAQDGVPQSPYWKEMQELINADMRIGMLAVQGVITPETGIFAKREIARFLRENPTDRQGAETLYKAISADDKKLSSRNFYREKYGYGTVENKKAEPEVRVWGVK